MNKIKIIYISIVAIFISNSLSAQTKPPKWVKGECQDSISILNIQIANLQNKVDSLAKPAPLPVATDKYETDIDKFLNIEDVSIFNNKFKTFPLQSIHPRSKDFYQLVENIHSLDELIQSIKKDFTDLTEINEALKTAPAGTINTLNQRFTTQNEKTKANLKQASKLIDTINEARGKNNYLSKVQNNYYKSLAKLYFEIYDNIYPSE